MQANTVLTPAEKRRPPAAGKGRVKGTPNKVTREVKEMITQALDKAGGVAYLVRCAKDPKTAPAFLTLVGKVLPLQVTGAGGGPLQIQRVERVIVDPTTDENAQA